MCRNRSIELGASDRTIAVAVGHLEHLHAATFTVAAAHLATHLAVSFTHALHGGEFAFAHAAALVGVKPGKHAIVPLFGSFGPFGPGLGRASGGERGCQEG